MQRKTNSEIISATFSQGRVVASYKEAAKAFYTKSLFGEIKEDKIMYSFVEALYLLDQGNLEVKEKKRKLSK